MKKTLFFLLIIVSLSSITPKQDCQCEGSINFFYNGKPIKELTVEKGYYITGNDCVIVKGEQFRFDSIVFKPQLKK